MVQPPASPTGKEIPPQSPQSGPLQSFHALPFPILEMESSGHPGSWGCTDLGTPGEGEISWILRFVSPSMGAVHGA